MTSANPSTPDEFTWLLSSFTRGTPGAAHTVVVSSDGLLLSASDSLPRDRADQLSAVVSGLQSLTNGAATLFEGGEVDQTVVEMRRGLLVTMTVSEGSCLAVLASPDSDIGVLAYEMMALRQKVGRLLTPELRTNAESAP
ncbi:roadblock/LC7 domain-containing protein [Kutzneria sp. CA-103260]|uniref:roadblock/LC7 domain-containing protein n=1 Tax=Kutzneria sp. CA-103260 TaxID=2802641 RepID=UPI001BA47E6E|nr:roadblock/LC7 domain-containing protein [Kutzneria sp. CA-103260]QUQ67894.1 roadblock/LC7 family protein [Kutzneria sp. CA-103260]